MNIIPRKTYIKLLDRTGIHMVQEVSEDKKYVKIEGRSYFIHIRLIEAFSTQNAK